MSRVAKKSILSFSNFFASSRQIISIKQQRGVHFFSTNARIKPHGGIPPYVYFLAGVPVASGLYTYYRYLDEVPLTNRKRWIATSAGWERNLGNQEYRNLKRQFQKQTLPKDHRACVTVERVGTRVANAAREFASIYNINYRAYLSDQPTFTIVRSEQANAFVLPGNHIFVMTGLFAYAQSEDELAAVLSHEMAHTLARHSGEKISSSFVTQLLARASLFIDPSGVLFSIILPTVGLLRDLPHSRTQESEADRIGMHLASLACYDPQAAQRVFERMKHDSDDDSKSPEFLSTHPSHESRIQHMGEWLPETRKIYRREGGHACQNIRNEMERARVIANQRHKERETNL
jgi:predicted Zn-dependent protease